MEHQLLCTTAAEIAKERLDNYLKDILSGEWDETVWEFYTYLLKEAKRHRADQSGYRSAEYLADNAAAIQNYHVNFPPQDTVQLPPRRKQR